MRASGKILTALVVLALSAIASAQPQRFITIGTGGVTGVYYGVGGALCQLMVRALRERRIDAFVYMVGHPAANIRDVTQRCDVTLVPLAGPEIDRLLREHPYYVRAAISGNMYRGNPQSVPTYGVRATLVASTEMGADTVYQIVKSVFDNFDDFISGAGRS